jgi:hypothetical protein
MSSIVYGGVKYRQITHAVHCKRCLETIESKYVNDFKYCSCGAVGIDGGISAGNRILGHLSDMEDRSMYRATIEKKKVWLPESVIEERHKIRNQNIFPMAETSARIPIRDEPESA